MKRKLRIEELSVASFSTGEGGQAERGTVRGFDSFVLTVGTCWGRTCDGRRTCGGDSCDETCYVTCDYTCNVTCPITACDQCD
jgi:hypothetical protein